jgi:hypothetical protein
VTETQQVFLQFASEPQSPRETRLQRWFELTNQILPEMANQLKWPVSQNHCFMRICLDESFGKPWHACVRQPAIRHMTDEQLQRAIDVAELIIKQPELIFAMNDRSIAIRKTLGAKS